MPAVALSQQLKAQGYTVTFVTDSRGHTFIPHQQDCRQQDFETIVLPLPRYQGGWRAKIHFAWALLRSIGLCWNQMKERGPEAVIGFGGYATLPLLLTAILWRCPILLHEQNAVLGRVNRLIGWFARIIALSTPIVYKCPMRLRSKLITTGLPVRRHIEHLRHAPPTPSFAQTGQLNLLVIGGSQGAAFFNHFMPQALAHLPKDLQKQIKIRHQCRPEDWSQTKGYYAHLDVRVEFVSFFEDMAKELSEAHLIFARAGASTIAEISLAGKAAFFVPFPYAVDNHQTVNAQLATTYGGGWWCPQQDLQPAWFARFLQYIMECPALLPFTEEALRRYGYPQATERFAEIVTQLIAATAPREKAPG
jgi:UDP-N-acetylglucosamine--N-acetylmuramyl-(pentapeptide) pyrophosphoryl-undecaprenol N-acetylglucosamine transferase